MTATDALRFVIVHLLCFFLTMDVQQTRSAEVIYNLHSTLQSAQYKSKNRRDNHIQ